MQQVKAWVDDLGYKDYNIEKVSGDASHRKYYRLILDDKIFMIMDSSMQIDSIYPFIDVSVRLLKSKVQIPRVYAQDLQQGYLLLEDLGDTHLRDILNPMSSKLLYTKAIYEILKMQDTDTSGLDLYDEEFLMFEMGLMQEWYLEKHLGIELDSGEQAQLDAMLKLITTEVLSQPQGYFVHRDFHSKNIMFAGQGKTYVIDYQDARIGAITYDLASLLNDVYIQFDREKILELILEFKVLKGLKDVSDEEFIRWFDFMAMQRHLKILGVFARLKIRDNKPTYLADIPLTLTYIRENIARYKEFAPLKQIFDKIK